MGARTCVGTTGGWFFAATPHGAFSSEAIGWSLLPFRALGLLPGGCDAGVCGSAPGEGNFIVTTRSRYVGFVRTLDSNNGAVIGVSETRY